VAKTIVSGVVLLGFLACGLAARGQGQGQGRGPSGPVYVEEGGRYYRIEQGIAPRESGISLQFAPDDYVQIQVQTADRRVVTVRAKGFTTTADALGMTITAIGPAGVQFSPQPKTPGVIEMNRESGEPIVTQSFELTLPRAGAGAFKMQIR
jgi:hypothetical protein